MSTTYNLVCHDCRTQVWVAQSGLSGFTFYSGDPRTMEELSAFFSAHQRLPRHRLEFAGDHRLEEIADEWAAPTVEPAK